MAKRVFAHMHRPTNLMLHVARAFANDHQKNKTCTLSKIEKKKTGKKNEKNARSTRVNRTNRRSFTQTHTLAYTSLLAQTLGHSSSLSLFHTQIDVRVCANYERTIQSNSNELYTLCQIHLNTHACTHANTYTHAHSLIYLW